MQRLGVLLLLLGLLPATCTRPLAAGSAWAASACTEMSTPPVSCAMPRPRLGLSPAPFVASRIITRADQGRILHLAVGEAFTLRLGSDTAWDVRITDPRVVTLDRATTPPPGEQGTYRARATGVTELMAMPVLPCTKDWPPCRVLVPAFRLLIVVS